MGTCHLITMSPTWTHEKFHVWITSTQNLLTSTQSLTHFCYCCGQKRRWCLITVIGLFAFAVVWTHLWSTNCQKNSDVFYGRPHRQIILGGKQNFYYWKKRFVVALRSSEVIMIWYFCVNFWVRRWFSTKNTYLLEYFPT